MQIGEDVIQEVSEQVSGLLSDYKKEINEAYLKASNSLTVDLSVKFTPEDGGSVYVETGISFVKDRVKAKTSGSVIEGQMKLDLEGPRETDDPARFCPVKGERVRESFCNSSCHLQLEILVPDGTIPIPTAPVIPADESVFVQFRPCAAWADDITQANVHKMLLWEPPPTEAADPPAQEGETTNTYRIRHKQSGEWWEGEAAKASDACILAGWNTKNCEIKVRNSGGNWCKCREMEVAA